MNARLPLAVLGLALAACAVDVPATLDATVTDAALVSEDAVIAVDAVAAFDGGVRQDLVAVVPDATTSPEIGHVPDLATIADLAIAPVDLILSGGSDGGATTVSRHRLGLSETHACFASSLGLYCWGANAVGQLGDGMTPTAQRTPVKAAVSAAVTHVTAGGVLIDGHTMVLTGGGAVLGWGSNRVGELGDGNKAPQTLTPTTAQLQNVATLATSYAHSCALVGGGDILCWGANFYGGLGLPNISDQLTPAQVSLPAKARALALGSYHTCVALVDGRVACWGRNDYGGVGDGLTTQRDAPYVLPTLGGAIAVAAGYGHSCVLAAGVVRCWGWNGRGQLGNNSKIDSPTPVPVVGLPAGVVDVCAGSSHTCALDGSGGVWCWGWNYEGEIGDASTMDRTVATRPIGLSSGVLELACGGAFNCVRLAGDKVQCWGGNTWGALGDGSTASSRSMPGPVSLP